MKIANREQWKHVDFLPDDKVRIVGDAGGTPLALIGYVKGGKKGLENAVLAKVDSGIQLRHAVLHPLDPYELMGHSQEKITINEKL